MLHRRPIYSQPSQAALPFSSFLTTLPLAFLVAPMHDTRRTHSITVTTFGVTITARRYATVRCILATTGSDQMGHPLCSGDVTIIYLCVLRHLLFPLTPQSSGSTKQTHSPSLEVLRCL
jgi:hypothetical protein